ncbi:mucin TcMUCII [Trypanosoma cruzi Dm28c]|uniref:Mucin TcMUCII n=2 Tax=Trypanosoma cruzi TaxID=5693 RepID=V5B7W2_TRYCR|nr:mucin TcMUCII [Trypanosoma cruzi Dm28c]
MTTCRLLCALLVLALCCCPSVFATEAKDAPKVDLNASVQSPSGTGVKEAPRANSQSLPQGINSVLNQDNVGGEISVLTDRDSQTDDAHNSVNREVTDGDTGLKSPSDHSEEKTHEETEVRAKTTTIKKSPENNRKAKPEANTNATSPMPSAPVIKPYDASAHTTMTIATREPTTTTTTTTTRAPSTTTTTTTTTTTRAPSRLREIDGSLSSSAWVCAPLLLAASALAYTTVG